MSFLREWRLMIDVRKSFILSQATGIQTEFLQGAFVLGKTLNFGKLNDIRLND
jgi:hypothetical protein